MKAIILCSLVLLVSAATDDEERLKKIRQYRDECIKEIQVDPSLVDRADAGDFVADPKLYCFSKCFYQRAGFVNDKGELMWDTIKAKIPKEEDREAALKILEKCQDLKGGDACETVFLVHKCYFEQKKKE